MTVKKIKEVSGYVKTQNAILCTDQELLKQYKINKNKSKLINTLSDRIDFLEDRIEKLEGIISEYFIANRS